jgi:hypothetical protein
MRIDGVAMTERAAWICFGLFLVACGFTWYVDPQAPIRLGGQVLALLGMVNQPSIEAAVFCAAVAVVVVSGRLAWVAIHFDRDSLPVLRPLLQGMDRYKVLRSIIVRLLISGSFAIVILVAMAKNSFKPDTSIFDYFVIAISVYVVVDGVLDSIKFLPIVAKGDRQ